MKTLKILTVILFFIFYNLNVNAFNNERKGFVLGFGLGHGFSNFKYEDKYEIVEGEEYIYNGVYTAMGLSTNFKIGYAPSNSLILLWNAKTIWINDAEYTENGIETDLSLRAIGGGFIGLNYYFKPEPSSAFINFGIGYSNFISISNIENNFGLGVTFGIGYHLSKHLNVELNYLIGSSNLSTRAMNRSMSITNQYNVLFSINYIAF